MSNHTKGDVRVFGGKPELTDSRIWKTGVRIDIPLAAYKQRIKDTRSIGGKLISVAFGKTAEEAEANATLIAEAFNITNQSGYTPSQLLEQRNELLEALKRILKFFDAELEYDSSMIRKAKAAIRKASPECLMVGDK